MDSLEVPGLAIRREDAPGQTILHLEGRFDGTTAQMLRRAMEQLPAGILLDFSRVSDFRDVAVPTLTRGLEGRHIRLIGLPQHHERLFRYFGWRDEDESERAYYVPNA